VFLPESADPAERVSVPNLSHLPYDSNGVSGSDGRIYHAL